MGGWLLGPASWRWVGPDFSVGAGLASSRPWRLDAAGRGWILQLVIDP